MSDQGGLHVDREPAEPDPGAPQPWQWQEAPQTRSASVTLADVIRTFGPKYRRRCGHTMTEQQERVLRELMVCRTTALGVHAWTCEDCQATQEIPNSCGNRHCPTCQQTRRQVWAEELADALLPVPYHHVILTLPQPLSHLAITQPRGMYSIMLRTSAQALLRCGRRLL